MKENISFQDEAYNLILGMIQHFELKPGERINKSQLEDKLHLKVAPIRQAIAMLGRVGLIDVYAQSGSYVSKINVKAVYQARLMRETIERMVVGQAVNVIMPDQVQALHKIINLQNVYIASKDYASFFDVDDQFHQFFYKITNNDFIWEWLQEANLQFNRMRYLRLEMQTPDWPLLTKEHLSIVKFIESKDTSGAQDAVSKHLDSVKADVAIVKSAYPDYFTDDSE